MAFDGATFEIDPLTLTTPRARLEYMRDFLRGLPAERFDMRHYGDRDDALGGECGSPACIGGWARAKFRYTDQHESLQDVGERLFGLGSGAAWSLFYPSTSMADGADAYVATPSDAADVIDHLLRTGEVNWSVARTGEPV